MIVQSNVAMVQPSHVDEVLEQIKIYREWANNYLTMRSNVTYVDITAASLVTWFIVTKIYEGRKSDIRKWTVDNYWLFFGGFFALWSFSLWASGMCNIYSNSFWKYLQMATDLEHNHFGVKYGTETGAYTQEFLTDQGQAKPIIWGLTNNIWNLVNITLCWYASFVLSCLPFLAKVGFKWKSLKPKHLLAWAGAWIIVPIYLCMCYILISLTLTGIGFFYYSFCVLFLVILTLFSWGFSRGFLQLEP